MSVFALCSASLGCTSSAPESLDAGARATDVGAPSIDGGERVEADLGVVDDAGPAPALSATCTSGRWCVDWPSISWGALAGAASGSDGRVVVATTLGLLAHFDGERWARFAFDVPTRVGAVWAGADGQLRIVGEPLGEVPRLYRLGAQGLEVVAPIPAMFTRLVGPDVDHLYGLESSGLWRWDGRTWTLVHLNARIIPSLLWWDGIGPSFVDYESLAYRYDPRTEQVVSLGAVPAPAFGIFGAAASRGRPWFLAPDTDSPNSVVIAPAADGEWLELGVPPGSRWTVIEGPPGGARAIAALDDVVIVANASGCWRRAIDAPTDAPWALVSARCAVDQGLLVVGGATVWALGERWARGRLDGPWESWDEGRARTMPLFARTIGDGPTIALSGPFALLRRVGDGWRRDAPFPLYVEPTLTPLGWADRAGGGGVAWLSSRVAQLDAALGLTHYAPPPFTSPASIALHPDGRVFGAVEDRLVVVEPNGWQLERVPNLPSSQSLRVQERIDHLTVTPRGTLFVGLRDVFSGRGAVLRRDDQGWTLHAPVREVWGPVLVAGTEEALWTQTDGVRFEAPSGVVEFADAPLLGALRVERDGRATGFNSVEVVSLDPKTGRTARVRLPQQFLGLLSDASWTPTGEIHVAVGDAILFRYTP